MIISAPRRIDLLCSRPERHWASTDLHAAPFPFDQDTFGSHYDADSAIAVPIALDLGWHTARHSPRHSIRREPSARQLCDAQRHALAAETMTIGQSSDGMGADRSSQGADRPKSVFKNITGDLPPETSLTLM